MYKSVSESVIPLLIFTRTIYYVIILLYSSSQMHRTHNGTCFLPIPLKINQILLLYGEKRFTSNFEIFSCVNHFENYGNKPLGFLMNTFGNTIWTKMRNII